MSKKNPVKYLLVVRKDNEASIVTELDMTSDLLDEFIDWRAQARKAGKK